MAVTLDASSPASLTNTTVAALTTASFTPPAGSTIVAVCVVGNSAGSGTQTGAISDSHGGSWATDKSLATSALGAVYIFRRTTAVTNVATTVTFTPTGTNAKGNQLSVSVLDGASGSLGATCSIATALHTTITPTAVGSYVVFAACDLAGVTLALESGCSASLDTHDATNGETYGTGFLTSGTVGTSAITIGYTNTAAAGQFVGAEYPALATTAITATIAVTTAITATATKAVALSAPITVQSRAWGGQQGGFSGQLPVQLGMMQLGQAPLRGTTGLLESKPLTASITAAVTVTAANFERVALTAAIAASVAVTANITASSGVTNVTAAIAATTTVTATNAETAPLSSAISATTAVTAANAERVALTAAISATSAVTATNTEAAALSAAIAATSSLTATNTEAVALSAAISATTAVTATNAEAVALTSAIAVTTTVSAPDTGGEGLAAAIAATTSVSAANAEAVALTSAIAATTAVTAANTEHAPLTAAIAATTAVTATASVAVALTAAISATTVVTGSVFPGSSLTAPIAVTTAVTATAQEAVALSSAISATTAVTATNHEAVALTAAISATSVLTANITSSSGGALTSAIAATAAVTATATEAVAVTAAITAAAAVAGTLTVGGPTAITASIVVSSSVVANLIPQVVLYIFTPPVLHDGSPLAYWDRKYDPGMDRVTDEWSIPSANPKGFRLMSFYHKRHVAVTIYKMSDGTYHSDRPVPGLHLGAVPYPNVPISGQVNGTVAMAYSGQFPGVIIYNDVQSPSVVLTYTGGISYEVSAAEATDLIAAGLGAYVT